jgi:hypothetical protein
MASGGLLAIEGQFGSGSDDRRTGSIDGRDAAIGGRIELRLRRDHRRLRDSQFPV